MQVQTGECYNNNNLYFYVGFQLTKAVESLNLTEKTELILLPDIIVAMQIAWFVSNQGLKNQSQDSCPPPQYNRDKWKFDCSTLHTDKCNRTARWFEVLTMYLQCSWFEFSWGSVLDAILHFFHF